jgi:hypothetical protein
MKTSKFVLLLTLIFFTSLLSAQNPKASKWTVDRCTKITAKITKDLKLSKEDSVKFETIIIDKNVFEIEKLKGLTTPEEKTEVYKVSGADFIKNLSISFPKDLAKKIQSWWMDNYKSFNSL